MSDFLPITTPHGTAFAAFKSALIANLKEREALEDVVVQYDSPENPAGVTTEQGLYESIFWDDAGVGIGISTKIPNQENVVICGLPLRIEEEHPIPLAIQVMLPGTGGRQEAADHRVDELIFEVMAELAHNPTQGLHVTPGFDYIQATKLWTWERHSGILDPSSLGRGALARLFINVEARISFTPIFD